MLKIYRLLRIIMSEKEDIDSKLFFYCWSDGQLVFGLNLKNKDFREKVAREINVQNANFSKIRSQFYLTISFLFCEKKKCKIKSSCLKRTKSQTYRSLKFRYWSSLHLYLFIILFLPKIHMFSDRLYANMWSVYRFQLKFMYTCLQSAEVSITLDFWLSFLRKKSR